MPATQNDDRHTLVPRLSVDGAIARLELTSASGLNLLTMASLDALEEVCRECADHTGVRAVIVASTGRHFCGGLDLEAHRTLMEGSSSLQERRRLAERGARMIDALSSLPQPSVGAVNGVAAGGGACIAAACDFRIVSDDARIGYPEVLRGLNLAWHAVPHCVRLVGAARAKRMIMLGRLEKAATLLQWGFVDEVVAPDALEASARALADDLAANPPIGVQMIKKSINAMAGALDAAVMHMDSDQFLLAAGSRDSGEAINAFAENREPVFRGD